MVPRADLAERIGSSCPTPRSASSSIAAPTTAPHWPRSALRDLGYEDVASMRAASRLGGGRASGRRRRGPHAGAAGALLAPHAAPEVGVEGQLKLLDAKVLLLGAGGLGSPSALYLAAAGVGTIGIVDDDVVDDSNLQRQVIHSTERVGTPKTASAKAAIEGLNPDVEVIEHRTRLDSANVLELLEPYDIVVDGADNFPTRYLLNDASVRLRKPVVSASILGFDGQISTFVPYEGPCYRCLYPTPPPPELAPSCVGERRPRRHGRRHGPAAGERGDQARSRASASRSSAAYSSTRRSARASPSSRSAAIPSARSAARTRRRSPSPSWGSSPTTRPSAAPRRARTERAPHRP